MNMNSIQEEMGKMVTETLYKESKDTKLGITFFRRDPQDGASPASAIVSRIGASGAASGKLHVGERILSVQGVNVEGPLHAARMLRESEGFMKIGKLPKRDDFDANLERYQQIEAEAARAAMAAALPGQNPQSTPRTDAATPRGPGQSGAMSAATAQYSSGLRPLAQPGAPAAANPGLNINVADIGEGMKAGAEQFSARAQALAEEAGGVFAQLSARAGNFLSKVGSAVDKVAESVPTNANRQYKSARCIQKAWRTYASRGHFHESRGAVLMLQSAARRKKATSVVKYKQTLVNWAAIVIQEAWRRHKLIEKQKALYAEKAVVAGKTPTKGVGSRLIKSLSFSRRTAASRKKVPQKPNLAAEGLTEDDLQAAEPAAAPAGGETPSKGRRSLSFTRRKKTPAKSDDTATAVQVA